jgi:signal transduction histidine kinase
MLGVLRDDDDAQGTRSPAPSLSKIDDLVARVRDTGLGVELRIEPELPELPASVDLAAYRIVQESLTNVMKHGGPVAAVEIRCTGADLLIEVSDDGRPRSEPPSVVPGETTAHGIIGMRERVAVYGGELSAGPTSGGGFRVVARLPLDGVGLGEQARASIGRGL